MNTHRLGLPLVLILGAHALGCDEDVPTSTTPPANPPPLGSVAGTSATANASASAKPQVANDAPRNVILLTIDSMRADMPWQGYDRPIAPNLTELAKKSVNYPRAYSVSSYTSKSVGAMLSGRYPSTLYRGHSFFATYSTANVFFPEILQDAGHATVAGHAHGYFNRGKNLSQGFKTWKLVPDLPWDNTTDKSVTSDKLTDLAMEMLKPMAASHGKASKAKPFFVWLHYMDPHDRYQIHEESPKWGKKNRDRYDSEMWFTDKHVKRLLDYCEKQPWWDQTALVVSADHGEAFGEHKHYGHAFALWEVITRVPLFVFGKGIKPQTITERRSQIDLAPTILSLMGFKAIPDNFVGKSMAPEILGTAKADNREPVVLDLPADTNNPPTRAIVKGDFKLIVDGNGARYRLYNLVDDPGELKDLAKGAKNKETLDALKKVFDETWEKHPFIAPFGTGKKLIGGVKANGPKGPKGWKDDKAAKP